MHRTGYTYVIYKDDFPISICNSIPEVAQYFGVQPRGFAISASQYRAKTNNQQIYRYYDETTGMTDCSQKYFALKKCEIYKFWSE